MNNNKKPYLIAEIGCNHMGSMDLAREMISLAAGYCQVSCVKFQKRNPKELLSKEQYNSPHPNPKYSFGETYGKHREFLEFNVAQHRELMEYCQNVGVDYSCSVWDLTSAKEICSLEPHSIKIPSACNSHIQMIEYLSKYFEGNIHVSLGMTTKNEESELIKTLKKYDRLKDTVIFARTSGYPVEYKDVCLLEIQRIKQEYEKEALGVGFSGHHLGIAIDCAAYALGADYLERHFTMNKNFKGTDHAASLGPNELRQLRRDLSYVFDALTYKNREILEIEDEQRKKLKFSK